MSTPEQEIEKTPAVTGPPKSTAREYFESFVITLVMALFGMTFILQAVTVPTGSMQNTILIGDYLLVNKFIFTPGGRELPFLPQREIQRGDIIVFKYPGNKLHPEKDRAHGASATPYQVNYVKRVIGLPGETVEFRDDRVYINGELLPEHRIIGDADDNVSELTTREFEERTPDQKWSVYYSQRTLDEIAKKDICRTSGPANTSLDLRIRRWSCRQTASSAWVTAATTAKTAVTGGLSLVS